jgi:hypothetical protein
MGTVVGAGVAILAVLGYEHAIDTFGLYEWQRIDRPSRRTIPFLAGLAVVATLASFSGFWVASIIRRRGEA